MKKIILIIAAVLIVGGAAAYYFLGIKAGAEESAVELISYVPGDYFVTNVKGSNSLFKVTVVIMLDTDKLQDELDENQYIIRDTIIARLRQLTEEDIRSDDIQDRLRETLTQELNLLLNIDNIVTVYFSDFVMQ